MNNPFKTMVPWGIARSPAPVAPLPRRYDHDPEPGAFGVCRRCGESSSHPGPADQSYRFLTKESPDE